MNYLAHLYLADGTGTDASIGNLLADFTNPREELTYSDAIRAGIRQHRQIDRFTDSHPVFQRSRRRIDDKFRLLKGIMVDLFYDHFLAIHWEDYHPQPLEAYCAGVYEALSPRLPELPPRMQRMLQHLFGELQILDYRYVHGIERALAGMSKRLSRPNILGEGAEALLELHAALEADFREFFPAVIEFARREAMCSSSTSLN